MKGGETAEALPVPSRFPYCLDKGSLTFTVDPTGSILSLHGHVCSQLSP